MNARLKRLAERLPADTAALINAPYHVRYLTSYPSGGSWILLTKDEAYFLTDFRYFEMAQQTVQGAQCRMIKDLAPELAALMQQHNVHTLLVESDKTTLSRYTSFCKTLPAVSLGNELDEWLSELLEIKTPGEIAKIEQAQAIAEAGFDHILNYIREGVTEREVALELEFFIRRHGAEKMAFDCIVVSGENGSLPHGIPSDKPLCCGELLTMDFGAVVDGYHSDMTRTVAIGAVSDEQKHVYNTVLRAQQATLDILREGVSCVDADAAARTVIEQAGYGDCFGHATGHGVGLKIHEEPRLSRAAQGKVLRTGHVVTVEPGIYVAGRFGVRIEDMALITAEGYRNLTHSPKELICL